MANLLFISSSFGFTMTAPEAPQKLFWDIPDYLYVVDLEPIASHTKFILDSVANGSSHLQVLISIEKLLWGK